MPERMDLMVLLAACAKAHTRGDFLPVATPMTHMLDNRRSLCCRAAQPSACPHTTRCQSQPHEFAASASFYLSQTFTVSKSFFFFYYYFFESAQTTLQRCLPYGSSSYSVSLSPFRILVLFNVALRRVEKLWKLPCS
eukprot:5872803-Amphidinium_carterae.1